MDYHHYIGHDGSPPPPPTTLVFLAPLLFLLQPEPLLICIFPPALVPGLLSLKYIHYIIVLSIVGMTNILAQFAEVGGNSFLPSFSLLF